MENNPRFDASQKVPSFPYAAYAEMLGLGAVRITASAEAAQAWKSAFDADRPFVIEAITDPNTPLLPPFMPESKSDAMYEALEREDDGAAIRERAEEQQAAE
jgi:pyruvate dehydrogenase (quinone)